MTSKNSSYVMTSDSLGNYIQHELDRGASKDSIRISKRIITSFFEWLPDDKIVTKERLLEWRQGLKAHGYSSQTELNYVKGINRYLDFMGFSDIRFNRGKPKDIAGKQFGYLTAIEPTDKRDRKDVVWRCVCRCGNEVEYSATRLLTGNTVSCGCLRKDLFQEANKYIDGTSIRQSLEERVYSKHSISGYTGVTVKRGKWKAYIRYKGKNINLGTYTELEDAVKARARGKELVQMDAMGLLNFYEEIHKNDPALPDRTKVREENRQQRQEAPVPSTTETAIRSDNTSGCTGVHKKRNKWAAKITHNKVTYQLGSYDDIEGAVAARMEAEKQIKIDPENFPQWVLQKRQEI